MKRLLLGVLAVAGAVLVISIRRNSSPDELEEKIDQLQEKFRSLDTV